MAITVLLILAAMWAAVLLPPILRARTVQRSGDTIGDFRNALSVLGRRHHAPARGPIDSLARLQGPTARPIGARPEAAAARPEGMSPIQRRRRDVLVGLAAATGLTMLLGLATGSSFVWFVWFLSAGALGAYVWMLLRLKQVAVERTQKVHYLDDRRAAPAPASRLALTRSAGS